MKLTAEEFISLNPEIGLDQKIVVVGFADQRTMDACLTAPEFPTYHEHNADQYKFADDLHKLGYHGVIVSLIDLDGLMRFISENGGSPHSADTRTLYATKIAMEAKFKEEN